MKHRNLFKKFQISKHALGISTVFIVICLPLYIYFLYLDKLYSAQAVSSPGSAPYNNYAIGVAKDILLIFISIFGSTLISSLLIEVRKRNDYYADLLVNDVFSSPSFYNTLNDEYKQEMLDNLENNIYFHSNPQIAEMYGSIKTKLQKCNTQQYFFEDLNYSVVCTVKDNRIIKDIIRTVKIRSYEDKCIVKHYMLMKYSTEKLKDNANLESVVINETPLEKDDILISNKPITDVMHKKLGYDTEYTYKLKNPIVLSSQTDTVIIVKYRSVVPLSDNTYTCRVSVPCKKFSMQFIIKESPQYKLSAFAFGFWDCAVSTPNNDSATDVNIEFSDWIFEHDGAAVVLTPNAEAA